MLTYLTKAGRSGAGKLLALIYLLCVLAPSLASAFSDAALSSRHGLDIEHGANFAHLTNDEPIAHFHSHADGLAVAHHPRGATRIDLSSSDDAVADSEIVASIANQDGPTGGHHKSSNSQCCGTACLSGLPATMAYFPKPSSMISRCTPEMYRQLADSAPAKLYRPPIF